MKKFWGTLLIVASMLAIILISIPFIQNAQASSNDTHNNKHHVLLLSIDGFHAQDLARYVRLNPNSALAKLSQSGITYTNASTSKPSDSFPGILSMTTGGSPRTAGVYYDDSYDRTLSAPGSKCATRGTEVVYDESIDKDPAALNAGGGIDPTKLPLDPAKGCTPVYPHSFLRVNTIFEVARQAGLNTAWSDKHPAYDLLNGPSGKGVVDLYTPEIASIGSTVAATEAYDDLKVKAILNEIDGKDHTGTKNANVPAIFGMNFQAVSIGQKLAGAGYADATGAPSTLLQGALTHTDQSIGKFVSELSKRGLLEDTTVMVTAKHGQSPVDPNKHQIVDSKIIPDLVNSVQAGLLAQATQDDVSLLWLTDSSKTNEVVAKLSANATQANIGQIISGDQLKQFYSDPQHDSRTPDIVVLPNPGVIYTKKTATKIAEHGGFSDDDTHVALLVANPHLQAGSIYTPVSTTQIAPSILQQLDLNPQSLQAVRAENTQLLPGLSKKDGE